MTRTELETTVTLLGWVPAFNILGHYLYHMDTRQALAPLGLHDDGAYKLLQDCDMPQMVMEWSQFPRTDRMLQFLVDHHEAAVNREAA